eukprot:12885667-Prorocentrum_lima.AAC.1
MRCTTIPHVKSFRLIADQSAPFAMWDSGASHFLLPFDQLPKGATDTRKATVKLAVGNAPA